MFAQKKVTSAQATQSAKPVSMLEALEGRQMFSASPTVEVGLPDGGVAVQADFAAGKVKTSDISFVKRVDKSSPKLAAGGASNSYLKITLSDVLISSYN